MYGVVKFQAPFERLKEYSDVPEIKLNKAIIIQAIIDASNIYNTTQSQKMAIDAKIWLFSNSSSFQDVCCNAEMNPSFVQKICKQIIALNITKHTIIYSEITSVVNIYSK